VSEAGKAFIAPSAWSLIWRFFCGQQQPVKRGDLASGLTLAGEPSNKGTPDEVL
jgi:hypothetical protein